MTRAAVDMENRLVSLIAQAPHLMAALRAVRALGLSSWCIGAGAVRTLVWDSLHGFAGPSALDDVDVVHFDASANATLDAELQQRLAAVMPALQWEVTNQATVHRWFLQSLGQIVPPLASLEAGVATWPEFATCVGVSLDADDTLRVIAPHGLDDLFALRVRHNPVRADAESYLQRVSAKRFKERWPKLEVMPTLTTSEGAQTLSALPAALANLLSK